MAQRPFCFWVRGPELRLCELGHWVPQFIFFSGLAIPPGAAGRSTPLEDSPSSSTPGKARREWQQRLANSDYYEQPQDGKEGQLKADGSLKSHLVKLSFPVRIHVLLCLNEILN